MRSLGSVIRRDSWGLLCRQTVISMNLSKDHHRKLSSVSIRYESGEDVVFFSYWPIISHRIWGVKVLTASARDRRRKKQKKSRGHENSVINNTLL
jgi:hypothetical protein